MKKKSIKGIAVDKSYNLGHPELTTKVADFTATIKTLMYLTLLVPDGH